MSSQSQSWHGERQTWESGHGSGAGLMLDGPVGGWWNSGDRASNLGQGNQEQMLGEEIGSNEMLGTKLS